MTTAKILWVDDEIENLKPHIIFLEEKGYRVVTSNNGHDAIEQVSRNAFDIVFLDEQMPGISGIETLKRLKGVSSHLPVIMVTKSEEENIMEDAIGSQISDYLIKPVKPKQLLLALKKVLDEKRIVSEKTVSDYQKEFRNLSMEIGNVRDWKGWIGLYKKLVHWELSLNQSEELSMIGILKDQKEEANRLFGKYIEDNYINWIQKKGPGIPLLSHQLLREKVFPALKSEKPLFVIVIDNLRFDQWKIVEPRVAEYFHVESEDLYFSILPTTTQYARNALFSGLLPMDLERRYPDLWKDEEEEGSKNLYEHELLSELLTRNNFTIKHSYHKIIRQEEGKRLSDSFNNLMGNKLNVIVYNFVDALSHARTDVAVVRELAEDESAYRSITLSWFDHSPLLEVIRQIAQKGCNLIITTDHGSIRVTKPSKVVGDRNLNSNLRYKKGEAMQYEKRDVFEVNNPANVFLPKQHINTRFLFAKSDFFFAYPNNYNHYVKYYTNTFQHGGVSLEEMVVPVVTMAAK